VAREASPGASVRPTAALLLQEQHFGKVADAFRVADDVIRIARRRTDANSRARLEDRKLAASFASL